MKLGPRYLRWLLWLPVPLLLYWALRGVRWEQMAQTLGRLSAARLGVLLAVNLAYFAVLTGRWAWVLHGLGERLSVPGALRLAASRLAGFSVSYLTPGPQFGGEPVQLALARRWTGLSATRGSASLLLDKSFELAGNFAFLGVGALALRALPGIAGARAAVLFLPALLVLLPIAYLAAAFSGRHPLSALAARLPALWRTRPWHARLAAFLEASETEVTAYGRRPGRALLQVLLSFVSVWSLSVLEQWLALRFLGLPFGLGQTLLLQAGVKLAMLLPFPGALGALEAAQRTLFGWLGYGPETALALSVYVRARDLSFALAGLLVAAAGSRRSPRRQAAASRTAEGLDRVNEPAPKLFIFDMGGVVSRNTNVFIPVAAHLGLTPERFYELAREALARLITGAISGREFWEIFSRRSGLEVREDLLARFFQPHQDQDTVELVKRLRREARVVVGTNTIESHYRIHREQGDYEPFDAVYASHRIGLAKPDPAFYRYILQHEGCAAEEAVFTDDLQQNVQAAAALGIRAFHFSGAAELKTQIEELLRYGR